MREIQHLPAEVLAHIFQYLRSERDIQKCRYVSRQFHAVVCRNVAKLARPKFAVEVRVCSDELKLDVVMRRRESNGDDEASNTMSRSPPISTTINSCYGEDDDVRWRAMIADDVAQHSLKTMLSRVQISSLTVTRLTTLASNDHSERTMVLLGKFVNMLRHSKQDGIVRLELRALKLGEVASQHLSALISQSILEEMSLIQCNFPAWLSTSHLFQMSRFASYTAHDCSKACCIADTILEKYTYDIRHGTRKGELNLKELVSTGVSVKALCGFLLTWINIPEAPKFHFRVEDCGCNYQAEFVTKCRKVGLPVTSSANDTDLHIPSISHPAAYVTARFQANVDEVYGLELNSNSEIPACMTKCPPRFLRYLELRY